MVSPSPSSEKSRLLLSPDLTMPTITTVTPALWLARFAHLNEVCAKAISWSELERLAATEVAPAALGRLSLSPRKPTAALVCCAIVRGFHEPAGYVIERLPVLRFVPSKIASRSDFLLFGLPLASLVRRISANVRLTAFVLEVDLRLIQWRAEQVIRLQLHARSCRRADAQPIQPQRVAARDPVLLRRAAKTRPKPTSVRDRARRIGTRR